MSNWWIGATNAGLISLWTLSIAIVDDVTWLTSRSLKFLSAQPELWGRHHPRHWFEFKNSSSCHFSHWNGATNVGLVSLQTLSIAIVENVTELARLLKVLNAQTEIWGCQCLLRRIKFKNNSSCHFLCRTGEMVTNAGVISLWTLLVAIVENVTKLTRLLKGPNAWTKIWGCHHLRRRFKFKNSSSCCLLLKTKLARSLKVINA
jgi:pterin-4a-carbinolamine dehydratase